MLIMLKAILFSTVLKEDLNSCILILAYYIECSLKYGSLCH